MKSIYLQALYAEYSGLQIAPILAFFIAAFVFSCAALFAVAASKQRVEKLAQLPLNQEPRE
jgi:hypothetical protein